MPSITYREPAKKYREAGFTYRGLFPLVTEYDYSSVAWGTHRMVILGLDPGVQYAVSVQAVDLAGHTSGFGSDELVTASVDTIPPSTPAAPSVAGNLLAIQVSHSLGKATGGTFNLEDDLDHLDVHVDSASGFLPSAANFVGSLPANSSHLALGIAAVGSFQIPDTNPRYVKVIAVDRAGNKSSASAEATVTAELISDAHIISLTASKITAGTITANIVLAANFETGQSKLGDPVWSTMWHGLNIQKATANNVFMIDDLTGRVLLRAGFGGAQYLAFDSTATNALDLKGNIRATSGEITGRLTISNAAQLRVNVVAGQHVEVGMVGPSPSNHAGLSLSETNYNNIFIRRLSDGVVFFRVNSGGSSFLTFDSASGVLAIKGTVTATAGAIDGTLTVGGALYAPTTSASNRIEIQGGARADIVLWSTTTASSALGTIRGYSNGAEIFRIKPNYVSGIGEQFLYIAASGAVAGLVGHGVLIDQAASDGAVIISSAGRRTNLGGLGGRAAHAILLFTRGSADVPIGLYHAADITPDGGSMVLIEHAPATTGDNGNEFLLKMGVNWGGFQLKYSFREDGAAVASGTAAGWTTSSDERFKRALAPLDPTEAIATAKALAEVISTYEHRDARGRRRIGPTGQALERILPASVVADEDGFLAISPNEAVWVLARTVGHLLERLEALEAA